MKEIVWKPIRSIIHQRIFSINKTIFQNNVKRNLFLIYFAVNTKFFTILTWKGKSINFSAMCYCYSISVICFLLPKIGHHRSPLKHSTNSASITIEYNCMSRKQTRNPCTTLGQSISGKFSVDQWLVLSALPLHVFVCCLVTQKRRHFCINAGHD